MADRLPDKTIALAAIAVSALAMTGCGGTPPPPTPSPKSTVDSVAACVNQLVYWAKDILGNARDTGLDYQEMGLDGDQYEALRKLVDDARKRQSDGALPPDWLPAQAKAACVRLAARPTPTSHGNGWP